MIRLTLVLFFLAYSLHAESFKVLAFSKTGLRENGKKGYRHKCIEPGLKALEKLGGENGFEVIASEKSEDFSTENLKQFKAVIFFHCTQQVFNDEQKQALKSYVLNGGGFVGIHAATTTEYKWPWFGKLIGARFDNHPKIQKAELLVKDKDHPSTSHLPDKWVRTDEWYNFKELSNDIKPLIFINEKSYKGGKHGDNHPIAWYLIHEKGRSFYTALGHTDASYKEDAFMKHILGGILWAAGKKN